MSLLITSNTSDNEIGDVTSGINLPYSYTNNLQDTLRIPKNSEIAVQSVKINRDGVISLNKGQQFGIFFGTLLADGETNDQINDVTVPTSVLGDDDEDYFTGSAENIAEKIELAGNNIMSHPNLCKNASSVVNPGFTCEVERNASNTDFLGFKFGITNTDSTKNASHISATWMSETDDFAYNTGTRVLTNSTGGDDWAIGVDYPISQAGGVFSASILANGVAFECGLVRCNGDKEGDDAVQFIPSYYKGSVDDFFDWSVFIDSSNDITVYHCISDGVDELDMDEYDYKWMNSGAGFNAKVDGIDKVSFTVNGEQVKISLFKGATEYVLTDGKNTVSASNVKPTGMTTRFLFPKMSRM